MNDKRLEYDEQRTGMAFEELEKNASPLGRRLVPDEVAALTVFLATEGAYFLRFLAGIEFSDDEWADIFADIVATLGETKAAPA